MKYYITFSCGHDGSVDLVGPNKDREHRLEWYQQSGLCPDCYENEKEKERQAEKANDEELLRSYEAPELSGSERQIAWASEIRMKFLKEFQKVMDYSASRISSLPKEKVAEFKQTRETVLSAFSKIIKNESASRYWIDNREVELRMMISKYKEKAATDSTPAAKTAKVEAIMVPENQSHPGTVEIILSDNIIRAIYKKDDDFYKIVSKYHFHWDREHYCYERACTIFTGETPDRAAEICNALLRSGFSVMCSDDEIRRKAQQADFIPECRRWVKFGQKTKQFYIHWDREDKDFYDAAKLLPGSRWDRDSQAMSVPGSSWREILDFSDINGFQLSPGSQDAAAAFKAAEISVIPAEPEKPVEKDKLQDILNSSREILPDLRDDA